MRTLSWFVPTFLSVALGVCAGQTANFSGSWHLNVEKSHWGSKPKPFSVVLVIEHKNPVLQYRGTVTHVNEDTRDFTFSGAIDGKEYPMISSIGPGIVVLRRVDANTFESAFRNADGTRLETATTSLSRDGRSLTRKISQKTPEFARTWTEIYERR
jgi:hypothetical protein